MCYSESPYPRGAKRLGKLSFYLKTLISHFQIFCEHEMFTEQCEYAQQVCITANVLLALLLFSQCRAFLCSDKLCPQKEQGAW